jgi:hypothetical protein
MTTSWSTIISSSCWNPTLGFYLTTFLALVESPWRLSTSARGSTSCQWPHDPSCWGQRSRRRLQELLDGVGFLSGDDVENLETMVPQSQTSDSSLLSKTSTTTSSSVVSFKYLLAYSIHFYHTTTSSSAVSFKYLLAYSTHFLSHDHLFLCTFI